MHDQVPTQAQGARPYKSAAHKWEESYVRPVDSMSLMRNAAKGEDGMESYTRRLADAELEESTLHGSDDSDASSSSTAVGSERDVSRLPAPTTQPGDTINPSPHQRRYKQSLDHAIPDSREQLRNRSIIPQAPVFPELAIRISEPTKPIRPGAAHVREARRNVRADEISEALSPPIRARGYEHREADSRISVISDYIYPSGKEPEKFIPDPAKLCKHPDCPLNSIPGITHRQGAYYHKGVPNPRLDAKMFGASNPPKFIWTGFDDCFVKNNLSQVNMKELDKVIPFAFFHGFADDDFVALFEIGPTSEHARDMRRALRLAYKNQRATQKKKESRE